MKKQLPVLLGIIFLALFLYVIISANRGELPRGIRQLYMFPGGDKLGHVLVMGTFSFIANLILFPRKIFMGNIAVLVGTVTVFCIITLEELSQMFLANRSFDLIDLLCSYLGIYIGEMAVRRFKNRTEIVAVEIGK